MSECAKASQYAFIFCIPPCSKSILEKGNPLLPRCSPQDAASSHRLNASALGSILPQCSTNPGAGREEAEEKDDFIIFFLNYY